MRRLPVPALLFAAALVATPSITLASEAPEELKQEEIAPEELRKATLGKDAEKKKPDGWSGGLKLGATFAFTHSSNFVGSTDGVNLQLGLLLDGFVELRSLRHTWNTSLLLQHAQTKTPSIDAFVKSQDNLNLTTLYTYAVKGIDWGLGPYAKASLQTAIFTGFLVEGADKDYEKLFRDGTTSGKFTQAGQDPLRMTGPFEPLVLTETAGVFADPIDKPELTIRLKLGVGAQHILVSDGFSLADDEATTDRVELKQLQDSHQGGAELDAQFTGALEDSAVTWKAGANFFLPFLSTVDGGAGIDQTNMVFTAGLSLKLAKWASLDYVLTAKKVPSVSDEWQVQNGLLLTAGFNLL